MARRAAVSHRQVEERRGFRLPPDGQQEENRPLYRQSWRRFAGRGGSAAPGRPHRPSQWRQHRQWESQTGESAYLLASYRSIGMNDWSFEVVERIKAVPNETKLLVVDVEADEFYQQRNTVISAVMEGVRHFTNPPPEAPAEPAPSPPVLRHHAPLPPLVSQSQPGFIVVIIVILSMGIGDRNGREMAIEAPKNLKKRGRQMAAGIDRDLSLPVRVQSLSMKSSQANDK